MTFFVELVKANINMLRYVYAPRIDIRPGIVKVHMRAEVADRPAGACQLHRADAGLAGDGYQGRHAVHPLARRQDD